MKDHNKKLNKIKKTIKNDTITELVNDMHSRS